jgi:hypothetical protein
LEQVLKCMVMKPTGVHKEMVQSEKPIIGQKSSNHPRVVRLFC